MGPIGHIRSILCPWVLGQMERSPWHRKGRIFFSIQQGDVGSGIVGTSRRFLVGPQQMVPLSAMASCPGNPTLERESVPRVSLRSDRDGSGAAVPPSPCLRARQPPPGSCGLRTPCGRAFPPSCRIHSPQVRFLESDALFLRYGFRRISSEVIDFDFTTVCVPFSRKIASIVRRASSVLRPRCTFAPVSLRFSRTLLTSSGMWSRRCPVWRRRGLQRLRSSSQGLARAADTGREVLRAVRRMESWIFR